MGSNVAEDGVRKRDKASEEKNATNKVRGTTNNVMIEFGKGFNVNSQIKSMILISCKDSL